MRYGTMIRRLLFGKTPAKGERESEADAAAGKADRASEHARFEAAMHMDAVRKSGMSLKWIPDKAKTEELCTEAVRRCPEAMQFVPEALKEAVAASAGVQLS